MNQYVGGSGSVASSHNLRRSTNRLQLYVSHGMNACRTPFKQQCGAGDCSPALGLFKRLRVGEPLHSSWSSSAHVDNEKTLGTFPVLEKDASIKTSLRVLMACCALYFGTAVDPAVAGSAIEPVYFGNGCFWGRQYDFVKAEEDMGRTGKDISAVVGYAGGRQTSPSNKVCYYYTPEVDTIYEKLGHAEVVKVELRGEEKDDQFRKYAKTYFSEFRRLKNGKMQRQDPQDTGAGYRNTIGIPGGVHSDLYKILQEENVNNMDLREGSGNEYTGLGKATEDDELNTVWIIDSDKFPFYQAEIYHQFHNGLGKRFPTKYTKDLKDMAIENKIVKETGCPEYFFLGS